MDLALLTLAAFATAVLTAALGLGGGVILMLLMPGLIPNYAILPVHAFVQTVSNCARVGFTLRQVDWELVPPLVLGSVLGAYVGSHTVEFVSLHWLPAIAGTIILIVTWLPLSRLKMAGKGALVALGFYQTGLGMLAGATGPLGAAVLVRINAQRDWLVVNTGVYMVLNHFFRTLAFALLGFAFMPWWHEVLAMSIAMVPGAWIGTRLRYWLPQQNFARIFRWLISILALRMIALTFLEQSM